MKRESDLFALACVKSCQGFTFRLALSIAISPLIGRTIGPLIGLVWCCRVCRTDNTAQFDIRILVRMDHGPAVPPTSDTIALRHSWTRSSDTGADGTKGLAAHTKLPTSATDPKYKKKTFWLWKHPKPSTSSTDKNLGQILKQYGFE